MRTAAREPDGATFVLRDGDKCFYADEDAIAPLWKGMRFPLPTCISGWAMLNRRPAVIEDIYADARVPHEAYRPTFAKSLAMVPIRTMDPIGSIGIYWARRHRATDEQIGLARALADSTAVALGSVQRIEERNRTQRHAGTHTLTGVANPPPGDAALARASVARRVRARAADRPRPLQELQRRPRHRGRSPVARVRDDLNGACATVMSAPGGAVRRAHRGLRHRLPPRDRRRIRAAVPRSRTASVGIATWDRSETAEQLVARADVALYEAKARGRDRTIVAD